MGVSLRFHVHLKFQETDSQPCFLADVLQEVLAQGFALKCFLPTACAISIKPVVKDGDDLHEVTFQRSLGSGDVRKSEYAHQLNCNVLYLVNGALIPAS